MSRPFLLLVAAALLAAGCTAIPAATGTDTIPSRPSTSPDLPATVPPTDAPVTGEVPGAILEAVRARLATDTGLDAAAATITVAESVEWNDGSLGCPERGVLYTQAIVPGFRVVLTLDGTDHDYRVAADSGAVRRCEAPGPIGS